MQEFISSLWDRFVRGGTLPEGVSPLEMIRAAYEAFLIDEKTYRDYRDKYKRKKESSATKATVKLIPYRILGEWCVRAMIRFFDSSGKQLLVSYVSKTDPYQALEGLVRSRSKFEHSYMGDIEEWKISDSETGSNGEFVFIRERAHTV